MGNFHNDGYGSQYKGCAVIYDSIEQFNYPIGHDDW